MPHKVRPAKSVEAGQPLASRPLRCPWTRQNVSTWSCLFWCDCNPASFGVTACPLVFQKITEIRFHIHSFHWLIFQPLLGHTGRHAWNEMPLSYEWQQVLDAQGRLPGTVTVLSWPLHAADSCQVPWHLKTAVLEAMFQMVSKMCISANCTATTSTLY